MQWDFNQSIFYIKQFGRGVYLVGTHLDVYIHLVVNLAFVMLGVREKLRGCFHI